MFRVTKTITFCYGHRLLNYEGKCRHLHGHNGRAEIELVAGKLDARGMVIDFSDIKNKIGALIDAELDHHLILCKDDPLVPLLEKQKELFTIFEENPTAENIAKWIYEAGKKLGIAIASVKLWETDTSFAVYSPH